MARESKVGRKEYYYYNRSGNVPSKSTGKRSYKSQGSRKIERSCPATLRVLVENDKVSVDIDSLHYGHIADLCHISIPKSDREEIAGKLSQGVNHSRILRNMFENHEFVLERKHICTKQDILNISRSYGIGRIEKHPDDHTSVDIYVEELKKEGSLLLYKRQGDEFLHYPNDEACSLEKNDFLLGVMTKFQRDIFKRFGNNIVCLDGTHGTNSYDFNLITVLLVDEYREGVPVAWLLSNKETSLALTLFFEQIKKQIDDVSPKVFMSDKAPQYFNSWIEVFGAGVKKLLCHWHVHQDWKRQLNKIKNKELASTVYKQLCLLLEENEEGKFNCLLQKYLEQLIENPETEDFGKYFEAGWMPIKEEWAKCYRIGCGINSNMFIESFHKTLKYGEQYLNGKQGKRIDKCLSVLLQFEKDLAVKRLIKMEKGKTTWKTSEIHKRHKAALELPSSLVCKLSSYQWQVKSQKSVDAETSICDNIHYKIEKKENFHCDCKVQCKECNICLHSYSCDCPDGLSGMTICKHIHLIAIHQKMAETANAGHKVSNLEFENAGSASEIIADDSQEEILRSINPETGNIDLIKRELLQRQAMITKLIEECSDRNTLLSVKEHQNVCLNLLTLSGNVAQAVSLQPVQQNTANKNVEKQRRFFSTKKNKKKASKYQKPTFEEKVDLEQQILKDAEPVKDGDHIYNLSEQPSSSQSNNSSCTIVYL